MRQGVVSLCTLCRALGRRRVSDVRNLPCAVARGLLPVSERVMDKDLNERQVIALERIARVLQGMYRMMGVVIAGAQLIGSREPITDARLAEVEKKVREAYPDAWEGVE